MVRVIETTQVGRVTGAGSASRTDERFGITATDLGILWDGGDGRVRVLFGDTYGAGWGGGPGGGPGDADWRFNVLAFSGASDLSGGLPLDEVIARDDGMAAQIIDGERGRRDEHTIIPNAGIAVDGTEFVHYMSIRQWGEPGTWSTNYAGIAVSADGARTWDSDAGGRWINRVERDHPFQIGAFARDGEYVLLFGTTNGRFGDAYLARVPAGAVADVGAYEYWTGEGWGRDEFGVAPVFHGPVGELSVAYNVHFGQWMAVHLDEHRAAIVLRTADDPTGPWSAGEVLASGADHPALYGGYLHPWSLDGPDIHYLVSQWGPYNVFLFRSRLAA